RPFELGIKSESGNSDYNGTYAYDWGVITAEGVSDVESLATPSGDSLVFGNNGNFATLKYTWSSDIARHIIEPPIVFEVNIQVVDNF
ncbi:MAG: hypothetical protein LBH29_03615, partial [Elusimicrobiota bacterium]|nr:hypothetical protein [Elusimicrobiota bacterium]